MITMVLEFRPITSTSPTNSSMGKSLSYPQPPPLILQHSQEIKIVDARSEWLAVVMSGLSSELRSKLLGLLTHVFSTVMDNGEDILVSRDSAEDGRKEAEEAKKKEATLNSVKDRRPGRRNKDGSLARDRWKGPGGISLHAPKFPCLHAHWYNRYSTNVCLPFPIALCATERVYRGRMRLPKFTHVI
jgi:hypothetical protein